MPAENSRSLRRGLVRLLLGIYALGFILLFVTNIVQSDSPSDYLYGFWLVQMAVLGVLFIVPGYIISVAALRPLLHWLDGARDADGEVAAAASRSALGYPGRALFFYALFGIFGAGLFHISSVLHDFGDLQFGNAELWGGIMPVYLNEFSLSMALGTAFAAMARRRLRPSLQMLPPPPVRDVRFLSVRQRILLIAGSLSLITGLPLLIIQLFARLEGWAPQTWQLAVLLAVGLAFSLYVGALAGGDISADLRVVAGELKGLTAGRRLWRKPLAMANDDEIGDLALAFNAVRARAEADDRELEAELELARRVQSELLPKGTFRAGGWSVSGISLPAREVGGDFFDVVALDDGRFAVAIGDASGKGMPASLLMAAALSMFRAQVREETAPGELLGRMNRLLCETLPAGSFIAMLYAVFDPRRMTCTLSSAGHVDPLLLTRHGDASDIQVASLPLGIDPDLTFGECEIALEQGQRLLLYSDGLPETRGRDRAIYGFTRLAGVAARLGGGLSGAELISAICRDVRSFAAADEPDDDLTAIIVEAPA